MTATLTMPKPKTESLTFRISAHDKRLLEEAVVKTSSDLTNFVLAPALQHAREIAEREAITILTGEARDFFVELLNNPPAPSEELIRTIQDNRHRIVE